GGRGVVYLGSFSRLLLPSIPLSFMILPPALLGAYREMIPHTHQSASMVEQMALCSYLSDGKLESQLRYQKRLYAAKRSALLSAAKKIFGNQSLTIGPAGGTLLLTVPYAGSAEKLLENLNEERIHAKSPRVEEGKAKILVSCFALPEEKIEEALLALKKALEKE
ncbi:MAG: PLP-dependent aminotransferase family protein, partial [Blautia sp.]|nr:PLP-dependent aminotransferase family protein [Blautia sp.]